MENQEKINLYRVRDFSESFSVLFDFLKQNYGPIIKGIVFIIPLLLIAVYLMLGLQGAQNVTDIDDLFLLYGSAKVLGGLVLYVIASVLVNFYTVAYMVKYSETDSVTVNSTEVWNKVKAVFFPLLGASILYGLAVGFGVILCLAPGIILWIYLLFYQYVYVAEDVSVTDSFSRSWDLVKENWFITFAFMLIIGILTWILSMVFSVAMYLPSIGILFDIPALSSDIVTYIGAFISYTGSLLLAPLGTVAIGVLYFSRRSDHDHIEINDNIDHIGRSQNNDNPYQ